jgi:precorrin-6A synthase
VKIRVLVIGIGTGNLDHLTGEAVAALNEVDLFLVADKGPAKRDLAALRTTICQTFIEHDYRLVEVPDPERDRSPGDYSRTVGDWHAARLQAYAAIVHQHLPAGGTLGFLVWGDPAFYDSSIRLAKGLSGHGIDVELRVVPGISSLQLLAARHQIALNQIGGSVHVTTGRRLIKEYAPGLGDVVVMLDGNLACEGLIDSYPDLQIFWGAQLGLPAETLLAGRLGSVLPQIRATRADIRAHEGWVMDTYLLRCSS